MRRSLEMRVWWPRDRSASRKDRTEGEGGGSSRGERPVGLEPTDPRPSGPAVELEVSPLSGGDASRAQWVDPMSLPVSLRRETALAARGVALRRRYL